MSVHEDDQRIVTLRNSSNKSRESPPPYEERPKVSFGRLHGDSIAIIVPGRQGDLDTWLFKAIMAQKVCITNVQGWFKSLVAKLPERAFSAEKSSKLGFCCKNLLFSDLKIPGHSGSRVGVEQNSSSNSLPEEFTGRLALEDHPEVQMGHFFLQKASVEAIFGHFRQRPHVHGLCSYFHPGDIGCLLSHWK